jgi:hypothetical protein
VHDDLLIEVAVCAQPVGQTGADQKRADKGKAGKTQQSDHQNRKHADGEDRQQRDQKRCLGLSPHRISDRETRERAAFAPNPRPG